MSKTLKIMVWVPLIVGCIVVPVLLLTGCSGLFSHGFFFNADQLFEYCLHPSKSVHGLNVLYEVIGSVLGGIVLFFFMKLALEKSEAEKKKDENT